MTQREERRVVYTSDGGRMRYCDRCGQVAHAGRCGPDAGGQAQASPRVPNDGIVRIARDKKGRGGKTMTVITGLPGDDASLATLAQALKKLCGSGGTAKSGVVEIQGDHRDRLATYLGSQGYRVKLAGG